jgi:hypothetical protein
VTFEFVEEAFGRGGGEAVEVLGLGLLAVQVRTPGDRRAPGARGPRR